MLVILQQEGLYQGILLHSTSCHSEFELINLDLIAPPPQFP
jgi:hypothetical protein